jgi:hypothetical protein
MYWKNLKVWSVGLIIMLLVAACSPSPTTDDTRLRDLQEKVDTFTGLQSELTSLQGEVDSLTVGQTEITALQSRLDSLQAQMDSLAAEMEAASGAAETGETAALVEHSDDPFAVSVAQYVLDTAGFHGMAETISETQQIDPAYLGTVNRVKKILTSTPWPESLANQGQDFVTLLDEFAAALEADDAEAAAPLSDEVHDAQHELSHTIDDWLGAAGGHED